MSSDGTSYEDTTMNDAAIARLSSTPWCRALITSPDWTPTGTASRVVKSTNEDSFFAETLATSRTIRACLTLRSTQEHDEDPTIVYRDVRTITELGDGLNGHPRIAHGGFVTTMLDEVMGLLVTLNMDARMRKNPGSYERTSCFTAYLNTSYKKPVPTPGVVLCTAQFDRRERNKIYVRGTIEDGEGTIYTVGEGMFVETKARL